MFFKGRELTFQSRCGLTRLMKSWKRCELGPWPRSWQRPAAVTHSTSTALTSSGRCRCRCRAN